MIKSEMTAEEFFEKANIHEKGFSRLLQLFHSQEDKRGIMQELHARLKAANEGKEVKGFSNGEERLISGWNNEEKRGHLRLSSGKEVPITAGEILTDEAWGDLSYSLAEDVPRDIKRKFLVSSAKRALRDILNEQYLKIGSRNLDTLLTGSQNEDDKNKKNILKGILKNPSENQSFIMPHRNEKFNSRSFASSSGFIAETLVETYLEQTIVDHNLSVSVVEVDVYEDEIDKADFLLRVPEWLRGVTVKSSPLVKNIGIQLTTDKRMKGHKEQQLAEVRKKIKDKKMESSFDLDDAVLVILPLRIGPALYDAWKKQGKSPGGPAKLLTADTKEEIFRGVLQKMLDEKTVNDLWEKVAATLPEDSFITTNDFPTILNKKPFLENQKIIPPRQTPKQKIETSEEINVLRNKISQMSKITNPSDKTKRKIGKVRKELKQLMEELQHKNSNKKTDQEKIEELKQKIENGIGNSGTGATAKKEPEPKLSQQELAQRAEKLLRQNSKNGSVKIYTPEEIAEYQKRKEN